MRRVVLVWCEQQVQADDGMTPGHDQHPQQQKQAFHGKQGPGLFLADDGGIIIRLY